MFSYDEQTAMYMKATGREAIADLADRYAEHLRNDDEVDANPEQFYDRVVEIDLSELEPHLVGPHTPDLDRPISEIAAEAEREGYPREISPRSSGRARTRRTKTSGAPRTSRARPLRRAVASRHRC